MFNFSLLLTHLQAVIAAGAARDRRLTVLLVALHGRIARMRTRLERLVALWRAGAVPKVRVWPSEVGRVRVAPAVPRFRFPTRAAWLRRALGYDVGAYGSQLRHMLTEAECAAFLAAVPQAGRILRPLLRMLDRDPLPVVLARVRVAVLPVVVSAARVPAGVGVGVVAQKMDE